MESVHSKQNQVKRTITLNRNFQKIESLLERILAQTGELIQLDIEWDEIVGKPTQYPPVQHTHPSFEVVGLEEALGSLNSSIQLHSTKINSLETTKLSSVLWDQVEDKPSTFPAASHKHGVEDLNLSASVKDVLSSSDINTIRSKLNIVNPSNSFTTNTTLYNGTSEVQKAKIFTTIVTAVDGAWSVDYAHVGFTEIFSISAIGQATGTALGDRNIACVANNGWSLTGCSGHLMSSNSAGLLAAMTLVNGTGEVHVTVYGK